MPDMDNASAFVVVLQTVGIAVCRKNKKGGKLIQLPTFFIVKFILQDCEVCDFDEVDLATVLFVPAFENGTEYKNIHEFVQNKNKNG